MRPAGGIRTAPLLECEVVAEERTTKKKPINKMMGCRFFVVRIRLLVLSLS